MKILGGVYQPDTGEILLDGAPVKIPGVNDSMRLGIAFIHQELNVLDNLDVAANVFLGREPRTALGLIDPKKIHADTEPFLQRLGLDVSSRTPLDQLSLAQQQMVEIAKALLLNARLIIMDEPTSSLTLPETERLLELVLELERAWRERRLHFAPARAKLNTLPTAWWCCATAKTPVNWPRPTIKHDRIVGLMVGREIESSYTASSASKDAGLFQSP